MTTALFLLKRREDYSQDPSYSGSYQIATGMWNSAKFVVDDLNDNDIPAEVQIVIDGNSIDSAVVNSDAKYVFIEGLWVTPAKMLELKNLARHASRTWIVRIHSEVPFLATEGIAMSWIAEYLALGITVAPNSERSCDLLKAYCIALGYDSNLIVYLPNCYPVNFQPLLSAELDTSTKNVIDVACFGAYRPMKNHLQQALLAMRYAQTIGKKLRFHVNDRRDNGGQGPFNNVKGMFDHLPASQFELVQHSWEDRDTFLQSLKACDFLMQVSLSETFNIVAADAVYVGRPVIASDEISWIHPLYVDPTDHENADTVINTLLSAKAFFINSNRSRLRAFAKKSRSIWTQFILQQ